MSGPIGSSQWMYSTGAASFFDKSVDNSLRLNSDSSYLYFAQGTPTDISKWTINFWLKRTHPLDDSSDYDAVFGVDGPGTTGLAFLSGNVYLFINYNTGGSQARLITNRVFRDPSAWYNFHISFDRANSTDAHKVRLYINGVEETSFSTDERSNITSSSSSGWNVSGLTAAINRRSGAVNSRYHNGYFAQFYNIDGQALDPTSFIEISDGVCKPITYSGTYGNNGWLLEFKQTGTGTGAANTVGADTSGNNNHWTSSGVASHDVVLDSPTNNFAVMNPLDKNSMNISEGNLKVVPSGDYKAIRGTFGIPTSGKWYFEARYLTPGGGNVQDNQVGIVTASNVLSGSSPYPQAFTYGVGYLGLGQINRGGSAAQSSLTAVTAGKILGVAVNVDDDEVQFYLDGSAVGTTHALVSTTEPNFPFYVGATNRGVIFNFGQDSTFTGAVSAGGNADANGIGDFAYAPPANHLALCASNLPEPTIGPGQSSQADDHFNTVLYTANNQTAQSITGVGFQPDWIWIKERSTSEHHVLIDVVRGSNKTLLASVTNVENTNATAVTSFDSDGFSLGTDGAQIVNYLSETYVAWNWKAGGAASSNTDGTISSSVSANQTAGFSIVSYTGTGSNATVGHGLSSAPEFVLVKERDGTGQWSIQ